jgi:hypothetical protein
MWTEITRQKYGCEGLRYAGDGVASDASLIISGISPKQTKVAAAAYHADAPSGDRRYTQPSRIGWSGVGLSVSIGMGLSKVLGFALSI